MDAWSAELKLALSLAVDHLSLYQLTIEQGTAFGDRYAAGKLRGLPDDDLGADLYAMTRDICADAGMPAYEVSNHARDGAQSRHNLIYWRYGDYVGIGPGAHGRLTLNGQRWATECFSNPGRWLSGSKSGATELGRSRLSDKDQASEFLLMGLRLDEGINPERYRKISGQPLPTAKISELSDLEMITVQNGQLIVLKQGFMVLNAVISKLLDD